MVQGDVLEVSTGTGRNMPYYKPQHVSSVIMTDTSRDMLWHAVQKHSKQNPKLPATFCLADAQQMLSEPRHKGDSLDEGMLDTKKASSSFAASRPKLESFSPAQFDTVVDTFGLCSHADPKAALQVGFCQ